MKHALSFALFVAILCQSAWADTGVSGGTIAPEPPQPPYATVMDWVGQTICFKYSPGTRACFTVGGVTERTNVTTGPTPVTKSQFPDTIKNTIEVSLNGAGAPSIQFSDGQWRMGVTPISTPTLRYNLYR